MIDTLLSNREKAEQSDILEKLAIEKKKYMIITLHRPSNVDCLENLEKIIAAFEAIEKDLKLVFPIYPRTKKNIDGSDLKDVLIQAGRKSYLALRPKWIFTQA